jgi:hypothetical protein
MAGSMFSFNWGVFWAIVAALGLYRALVSRIDTSWLITAINQLLESQRNQVELLQDINRFLEDRKDGPISADRIQW